MGVCLNNLLPQCATFCPIELTLRKDIKNQLFKTINMSQLSSISPIDGRYHKQTVHLSGYFSEFGLIKYRVLVEVHYFLFLADKKFFKVTPALKKALLAVVDNFSEEDARKIKTIEATTNHDVKAVEYFLKEILDAHKASELKEWIHFGLTSQDINNTAIPLSWKDAMENNTLPALINLQNKLYQFFKINQM